MKALIDRYKKILFFIPDYAHLPLLFTFIVNCAAYYAPIIAHVAPKYDFSIALDSRLPVIPAFSYIYILAFVFWTVNYIIICRQSETLARRLTLADSLGKVVCVICFFAVPSTLVQPNPADLTGPGAWLLKLIYQMDEPMNLLPSIHCLVSWLCFRPLLTRETKRIPLFYKGFSFVFSTLICLSTLFTRQHVIWDWVAGVAVAEMGWQLAGCLLSRKSPGK